MTAKKPKGRSNSANRRIQTCIDAYPRIKTPILARVRHRRWYSCPCFQTACAALRIKPPFLQIFQTFTKSLQKGNIIGWAFLLQCRRFKKPNKSKTRKHNDHYTPTNLRCRARALHWLTVLGFIGILSTITVWTIYDGEEWVKSLFGVHKSIGFTRCW